MGAYLIRRLLLIVPVLFGVSVIVFLTMALIPGDPALVILGPYATAERVAALRHDLGLDRSVVQQYVLWIGNVLEGDFGRSFSLDRPVLAEVMDRLGPTALLTGSALVLSTVFGLAAGAVAAARQYGWTDRLLTALVLVGISTPAFWLGLMLILVFAVYLGWFPVSGMFAVYRGGDVVASQTYEAIQGVSGAGAQGMSVVALPFAVAALPLAFWLGKQQEARAEEQEAEAPASPAAQS